jgi:hypothetical protein
MVQPMQSNPASNVSFAAKDESTPPLIAINALLMPHII